MAPPPKARQNNEVRPNEALLRVWLHETLLIDHRSGMVAVLKTVASRQRHSCELSAMKAALERAEAVYFPGAKLDEREAFDRCYLSACHDLALAPRVQDLADCRSSMEHWMVCVGARDFVQALKAREVEIGWFGSTPPEIAQKWRRQIPAPIDKVVQGELAQLYAQIRAHAAQGNGDWHFVVGPAALWSRAEDLAWDELPRVCTASWSGAEPGAGLGAESGAGLGASPDAIVDETWEDEAWEGESETSPKVSAELFRPDSLETLLAWIDGYGKIPA